jgi:hypothetical protein
MGPFSAPRQPSPLTTAIVAAVQGEAQAYLERLSGFAYADGLPRVGVNLHRLVVVPRVLLNGAAFRGSWTS